MYRVSGFLRGVTLSSVANDVRGSIIVAFAITFPLVVGLVGVAIDYGRSYNSREKVQAALDSAVLAGVAFPENEQIAKAQDFFDAHVSELGISGVNATFTANGDGSLTGQASGSTTSTLSKILDISDISFAVTSTAKAESGAKACILVLDKTSSQALLVNSGPDIDAPECEIHVKSTASPAAIFNSGSSLNFSKICIAGSNIIDNGGTHPNLETGCTTVSDPYAHTLPIPPSGSCDYNNLNFNGGNVNLSPGVYCGWVNFNGGPNTSFAPGVYVIKNGGWNVNGGKWTGTGVTFYFADQSKIQFNSAVDVNMSAPTSGTYKGLFMYEPDWLSRSQFVLDDSRGFDVTGLIYLPSRDTTFNSGSNLTSKSFTLVVNTLILNNVRWDLSPGDEYIPSSGSQGPAILIN